MGEPEVTRQLVAEDIPLYLEVLVTVEEHLEVMPLLVGEEAVLHEPVVTEEGHMELVIHQ